MKQVLPQKQARTTSHLHNFSATPAFRFRFTGTRKTPYQSRFPFQATSPSPSQLHNFAIISIFLFLFFIPDICIHTPPPSSQPPPHAKKGKIREYSARAGVGCGKSIVVHSQLVSIRLGGGTGWFCKRLKYKICFPGHKS